MNQTLGTSIPANRITTKPQRCESVMVHNGWTIICPGNGPATAETMPSPVFCRSPANRLRACEALIS